MLLGAEVRRVILNESGAHTKEAAVTVGAAHCCVRPAVAAGGINFVAVR